MSLFLMSTLLGSGCFVKRTVYAQEVVDHARLKAQHEKTVADLEASRARNAVLTTDRDDGSKQIAALEAQVADATARIEELTGQRDRLADDADTLSAELTRLGRDVEKLTRRESTTVALLHETESAVETSRTELLQCRVHLREERARYAEASETLRAAEDRLLVAASASQEAEERDRIVRSLRERLNLLITAGSVVVRVDSGRMVVEMGADALFEGHTDLISEQGRFILSDVAPALADIAGRAFQVGGHTDTMRRENSWFASNWELSSARAVAVAKILVEKGVNPTRMSSAGFGEYRPRASNLDAEGRAANRRMEVVMQPAVQWVPDPTDG
jgi:chemotaxis protein MotB